MTRPALVHVSCGWHPTAGIPGSCSDPTTPVAEPGPRLQASNISDLATAVCSTGLQCTPLQGPFTASGYGFCTASTTAPSPAPARATSTPAPLSLPAAAAPSPAPGPQPAATLLAVQVAQRNTTSGKSCNLPMVVHGGLLANCTSASSGSQAVCFPDGQTSQPCAAQPAGAAQTTISGLLQGGKLSQGLLGQLCSLGTASAGQKLACQGPLTCVQATQGLLAASAYGFCSPLEFLVSCPGLGLS